MLFTASMGLPLAHILILISFYILYMLFTASMGLPLAHILTHLFFLAKRVSVSLIK